MAKSKSETGHAKNVANFNTMIVSCVGYGPRYDPFRELLTLNRLNTLYTAADKSLLDVKTTKTYFDNDTNTRATEFEDVPSFATKLIRLFSSCDISEKALDDAKGHQRKIQGRRAIPIKKPDENAPEMTEKEEDKHISAIQRSYDSVLDNFKELVLTVISQPNYQANEAEFTPDGLQQKIDRLVASNNAVIKSDNAWSNARIERDKILYHKLTGLKKTAMNVKNYVAGIFGMSSREYKQISGLLFTDIPK
jgi:hypothetical protein